MFWIVKLREINASEMGSEDRVDDRTFKVDFTGEGMAKLRERIKLKMKEFMGDYTDDTLVVRTTLAFLTFMCLRGFCQAMRLSVL